MELITKAPKGTVDIIPGESEKWSLVEAVMTDEAELNGFSEIRTPIFEHTELFLRGVGDTTDVVEKEMYDVRTTRAAAPSRCKPGGHGGRGARAHAGRRHLYAGALPGEALLRGLPLLPLRKAAGRPPARAASVRRGGVRRRRTRAADAEVIALAMSMLKRLRPRRRH